MTENKNEVVLTEKQQQELEYQQALTEFFDNGGQVTYVEPKYYKR